jgi:hypothetical protein
MHTGARSAAQKSGSFPGKRQQSIKSIRSASAMNRGRGTRPSAARTEGLATKSACANFPLF